MAATLRRSKWWVQLGSIAYLLVANLYQENHDNNHISRISMQLRDKYSICRCCWNVAIFKWKIRYGKIDFTSTVAMIVPIINNMLTKEADIILKLNHNNVHSGLLKPKQNKQKPSLSHYCNHSRFISALFIRMNYYIFLKITI